MPAVSPCTPLPNSGICEPMPSVPSRSEVLDVAVNNKICSLVELPMHAADQPTFTVTPELRTKTRPWNKWACGDPPLVSQNSCSGTEGLQQAASSRCNDIQSMLVFEKRASGDTQEHAEQQRTKRQKLDELSSVSGLVCIELCSGSASLSSALRHVGFQVLPLDSSANRHVQKVKSIVIDLSKPGALQLIKEMIATGKIFYLHAGPPCGTASRARDRPVSAYWLARGAPNPKPLRSAAFPMGLPGLSTQDQLRVSTANAIYALVQEVVHICIAAGIIFSVENPASSYMWLIPGFRQLLALDSVAFVDFDACMHGGERPKHTGLMCTKGVFESLSLKCDGTHTHQPWGMHSSEGRLQFDTALEAEYTAMLCQNMARLVLQQAVLAGYSPLPSSLNDVSLSQRQQVLLRRAQTGKLPRGRKIPQLLSEFKAIHEQLTAPNASDKQFRLLRRFYRANEGVPAATSPGKTETVHIVGEYRTPQEFMDSAKSIVHPMDRESIPDVTKRAIFSVLTKGPSQLSKDRLTTLADIKRLAASLQCKEDELHEGMDPHVKTILKGKRLLLFQALLDKCGYRDANLGKEMAQGFDIVGTCGKSNELYTQIRPATITAQELRERSVWSSKEAVSSCNGREELAKDVWAQCLEEEQAGWIRGPFSIHQINEQFPGGWAVSRRFGLQQGNKLRVIDDCRQPGINSALTSVEKLSLMDVDSLGAVLIFILSAIGPDNEITVEMSDGTRLTGTVHTGWKGKIQWQGRTLDLKAAYKGLAVSPGSKWAAILLAWNCSSCEPALFVSDAMLFGCTSAVYAFNRVSRGIWFIASSMLSLVATVFYDDFPCLEPRDTSLFAKQAFETLLNELGWEWSKGKKDQPFADLFSPLGVQIELDTMCADGKVRLSNKPSRVADQVSEIEGILRSGKLHHYQAAELHGKLQFSEAQIFGRASVCALRMVSNRANAGPTVTKLDPLLVQALLDLSANLRNSLPRTLSSGDILEPVVMYTDGAAETDGEGWGILMHDPSRNCTLVAGGSLPKILSKHYRGVVGSQIIGQVELFPIILARYKLANYLQGRRVIWYIDNDAARDGLIQGFSPSPSSLALISAFYAAERGCQTFSWFARVASYSNPADLPSRKKLQEAAALYGAEVIDLGQLPESTMRNLLRILPLQSF